MLDEGDGLRCLSCNRRNIGRGIRTKIPTELACASSSGLEIALILFFVWEGSY